MKKTILKHGLLTGTLITGFFSWFSVSDSLKNPGMSAWILPITCFSLYVIFMCLAAILIRQEIALELIITLSLFSSLIFAFSKWHFVVLVFSVAIMLRGLQNIRKDLELNVRISLWKSLYVGKFKLIFALALIISSQYFFIIKNADGDKVIPKFDVSVVSIKFIEPILSKFNPSFKLLQQEGLTVDQFLIESQKQNEENFALDEGMFEEQIPKNLPSNERAMLKQQTLEKFSNSKSQLAQKNNELILQEGRRQLSQLAGREIKGDEKMTDVFAGFINKKLNDFFQPQIQNDSRSSFFIYIIVAILFLTVLSLGSFLSLIWFGIVICIFNVFRYFGLVKVDKMMVEREVIV